MADKRTLHHYFGGCMSRNKTLVERIMKKLNGNDALKEDERKYLLEYLQNYSERNHRKSLNGLKPKMVNKKIQAHVSAQYSRDYFAQTDSIYPTFFKKTAQKEYILAKMEALLAYNRTASKEDIQKLMKATFNDRRNFILQSNTSITEIKRKYPFLFSVDEIKNELDRIFFIGKCDEFFANIDKYSTHILDKCDHNDEIYVRIMKNQNQAKTTKEKKYVKAVGSILALPTIIHENLSFVKLSNNSYEDDLYPYINGSMHFQRDVFSLKCSFEVKTERTPICSVSNFEEAILCLMASFFIFHLNYPDYCRKTLIVFEKLYLEACDTNNDDIDERTKELVQILKLKASGS